MKDYAKMAEDMMTGKSSEIVTAFVGDKEIEGSVRLSIDFPNAEKMADWFQSIKESEGIAADTSLFRPDGLDDATAKTTFIVKRESDRPERFKLRVRRIDVEEEAI